MVVVSFLHPERQISNEKSRNRAGDFVFFFVIMPNICKKSSWVGGKCDKLPAFNDETGGIVGKY